MGFSKQKPRSKSLLQVGSQASAEVIAPPIFIDDSFCKSKCDESSSFLGKEENSSSPPQTDAKKAVFQLIKEGWGTITWPSGDRYEGNVKGHRKHGFGIMKWKVGDEYQGRWNMDKREDDRGRYSYHHGIVYDGGFKKDRRHGEGTLTWPNGDKYIGTWVKGSRKGKGVFITADGFQVKQVWNEPEDANYSKEIPPKFPKGMVNTTKSP